MELTDAHDFRVNLKRRVVQHLLEAWGFDSAIQFHGASQVGRLHLDLGTVNTHSKALGRCLQYLSVHRLALVIRY